MSSSCIKGVFPRILVQGLSVAYLRKKLTRTTWPETHIAARNNEAYGLGNRRLSRSVQSFAIIKNAGHGNFVIGCFHTRAVCRRPLPHRHPFSDFFLLVEAAVHRLSETGNQYLNCPSKLTIKVRWIVHSKLKQFRFETKTYCLSDTNYQTDNPSHANHPSPARDPSLVWKQPFLL